MKCNSPASKLWLGVDMRVKVVAAVLCGSALFGRGELLVNATVLNRAAVSVKVAAVVCT
jgi:hypothetical protein